LKVRRIVIPELLDTDAGTPQEVADSLADLRMFNRCFGGVHTTTSLLKRVADACKLKRLTFLDVAGASGYVATQTTEALAKRGIALEPVLLDRAATHLNRQLPAVAGDALQLPFADDSIDVVGCNLFAHHLEPDAITAFAREALRVSRHAFVINDLRRSVVHLALAYAGFPLYRSRITRNDAPASVKRAYTEDEMRQMLSAAGGARIEFSRHYLYRMGVIVWKH
jgi:ubiquinone/menaquinone biosynthesis C-methylase UbiE